MAYPGESTVLAPFDRELVPSLGKKATHIAVAARQPLARTIAFRPK